MADAVNNDIDHAVRDDRLARPACLVGFIDALLAAGASAARHRLGKKLFDTSNQSEEKTNV
ncbi:MAG: hypothetical protein OEN20_02465 [Gammaproteobacteria bacterium]|nr:hypothetical protein [Gammaproteobacteria bacterium]